jgi:hypothetical protein
LYQKRFSKTEISEAKSTFLSSVPPIPILS